MISLTVRVHIFLNALAFLRLVLLSRFLQNEALAKQDSFGASITLLQKRQLFSVAFILFLAFEGVLQYNPHTLCP